MAYNLAENKYLSNNHRQKHLKLSSILGKNDSGFCGMKDLGICMRGWAVGDGDLGYDLLTGSSRMNNVEGARNRVLEIITILF